jgi:hypothetical protein
MYKATLSSIYHEIVFNVITAQYIVSSGQKHKPCQDHFSLAVLSCHTGQDLWETATQLKFQILNDIHLKEHKNIHLNKELKTKTYISKYFENGTSDVHIW